ncbi:MAG TPA: hypothetical protein DER23_04275 [Clostridiales bacterium]|jgi:hypothetical protein|nr:hypothetical protein [Clostridiales bacterium]
MKTYVSKTISIVLVALFICFSFSACTGTGETKDDSTRSENSGNEGGNSIENDKNDEEIITEDEKHGKVAEGMLGAAGDLVDKYSGYLGYGYNILTAAYYNHKDIKTGHPIIDMDSLVKKNKIYVENKSSQHVDSVTFVSSSAKEYSEHFACAANINAKIGFTGSFEASFKQNHTFQMNSNQKLITTQALLETQNDYIIDVDAKLLAENVTSTFKKAVTEKTAKELIDLYGTHVLANITLGGRFDIHYFYTRTETSESTDIEVSARASYRSISGSASAKDEKDKTEIETHSSLFFTTYGGSVTGNPTSVEAAIKSYKDWSTGVENGKITFINASEVIPLWDIVANLEDVENAAEKSAAIKQYFDARVDQISGEFKESVNTPIYISDVYVGYGKTESEAKNMLRSKGVTEGHIVNLDLNTSVGGYWIYLGYKTTTDKANAITNLVANYYSESTSSNLTYNGIKYNIIPVDLNKGAKGKYIYLYYTRDQKAGNPICAIQYQHNEKFQFEHVKADGYNPVNTILNDNAVDLNKGSGGDYIYLWFKRS